MKGGAVPIQALRELECRACPLEDRSAPDSSLLKILPAGKSLNALIYFLFDSPEKSEIENGRPFSSRAGKLLKELVSPRILGESRFGYCIRSNPPNNRNPSIVEIECCRPSIERDIEAVKPKAIFGFGTVPLVWAGEGVAAGGIHAWRGRRFPVRIGSHVCWYFPMIDPTYILHLDEYKTRMFSDVLEKDLNRALDSVMSWGVPFVPTEAEQRGGAEVIESIAELTAIFKTWNDPQVSVAFDLETSCLRPYDGKILTMALASKDRTITFPLDHPESFWRTHDDRSQIEELVRTFFSKSLCRKIAHNLSFDLEWIFMKYGVGTLTRDRLHCTMAQGYVLDERSGMLSLNDLVAQYFGFNLKALSDVDKENLAGTPVEDVLAYNALDAKWTVALFEKQAARLIDEGLTRVYEEQRRRIPTLVVAQSIGLIPDVDKIEEFRTRIVGALRAAETMILADPAVEIYREQHMAELNIRSTKDLTVLFTEILKHPELITDEGKVSTDVEHLSKIDHPLGKLVGTFREFDKLNSTYIEPLSEGGASLHNDGRVHTSFKSCHTATRRLSSADPNVQNFPKRENSWVRGVFRAPQGHYLVAIDYGQIEFRVIVMASKAKKLIEAVWNRLDIHMEWAEKFAWAHPANVGGKKFLKDKQALKKFRGEIKNTVVFPLFFGSATSSVAASLNMPMSVTEPLVEEFWAEYDEVKKWQKSVINRYYKTGYVETLTGFRRRGPLNKNKIINTPIQGTASDIVIDGMNRLSEYSQKTGCIIYQPVMNIHDDLTFVMPKVGFENHLEVAVGEMLKCKFGFINVPLSVEVSIGENWGEMEEVGTYFSNDWEK